MEHEDDSVPLLAEQCAAQRSHILRRPDPAGSLEVEFFQHLQFPVEGLIHEFRTHLTRLLHGASGRGILLPLPQSLVIVAQAPTSGWCLPGTVAEEDLPVIIGSDDIRFPAGVFHALQHRTALRPVPQAPFHRFPVQFRVTVPVFLKS